MNNFLRAVSRLVNVVSVVLRARGQRDLADFLKGASILLREGEDATEQFNQIAADVEAMVAAGVDPTVDQLEAVRENRFKLSNEIQDVVLPPADEEAPADNLTDDDFDAVLEPETPDQEIPK